MNTTTRCYPRTSLRQSDAAYGAAITRTAPKGRALADKAVGWALAVAVIVIVLSVAFGGPGV